MSDYHAAYYQDNRDRLLARARANYLAKREAKLAAAKLYDNKSIEEMAWQAVRPVVFERPFSQSQDTN